MKMGTFVCRCLQSVLSDMICESRLMTKLQRGCCHTTHMDNSGGRMEIIPDPNIKTSVLLSLLCTSAVNTLFYCCLIKLCSDTLVHTHFGQAAQVVV